MARIIISENVTLDGVIQDPAGNEGFTQGGWVGRIGDRGRDEAAKVALDEALGTEAMLLGRRTYEFLAARWPSRTGAFAANLEHAVTRPDRGLVEQPSIEPLGPQQARERVIQGEEPVPAAAGT